VEPGPGVTVAQPASPFVASDTGEPVEQHLATDMARRSVRFIPFVVVAGLVGWGLAGAASSAYAIAIVLVNFLVAAALLSWTARISLGLMMGAALFGYLARLGLIGLAFWAVKDAGWMSVWPFGLTLVITHLGLLLWETRFVSASLAYPGLKPTSKES
jgi:branched-subunit amino acid transport protein AzlD